MIAIIKEMEGGIRIIRCAHTLCEHISYTFKKINLF